MRKKQIYIPKNRIEKFKLNKSNSVYLQNASHVLEVAAQMAEDNNDTDTLLQIAGAWLDIAKNSAKKPQKKDKRFPVGFTGMEQNGTIMDLEEDED